MVLVDSDRISPVPPYSGYRPTPIRSVYGTVTPCGAAFQRASTAVSEFDVGPTTPVNYCSPVWAIPRSLATTCGITTCFLFLRVLRCFSSPGCHPRGYYGFTIVGCPIRTSADQRSFAPPRSFSQLTTSFVVSESLGIPHTPLHAS